MNHHHFQWHSKTRQKGPQTMGKLNITGANDWIVGYFNSTYPMVGRAPTSGESMGHPRQFPKCGKPMNSPQVDQKWVEIIPKWSGS